VLSAERVNVDRCGGDWIGLVGAGSLGSAIGKRLLASNCSLLVWNRSSYRLTPLANAGARVASSVPELVQEVSVIVVCLSDVDSIRSVLLDGCVNWTGVKDRLVLNTSTVGAKASEALENDFAVLGVHYLEMPVSGGPEGAASGTLAAYLGRVPAHHNVVERLVAVLAKNVIRCADNRDAQQLKVLNNLCEAINLWGAAETFALGRRLGLSTDDLSAGLTGGRGDSRYLRVLLDHVRTQPTEVAVSFAIRTKDLQLAEDLAGVLPPLSNLTKALFDETGAVLGGSMDQCKCLERVTEICSKLHDLSTEPDPVPT
jgi:3-hydroxyisobutyrate dehydrogenase-like beta-hydroxyacid dehydrogenase